MGLSSALATAMSGLRANQAALSIISSNVANANTPGYVTQSLNQNEYGAAAASASASRSPASPAQLDLFVQSQLRTETSRRRIRRPDVEHPAASCKPSMARPAAQGTLETAFNNFTTAVAGAVDEFGQPSPRRAPALARRAERWRSS